MDRRNPLRPARRLGGILLALVLFATLAAPANAAPRREASFFGSAWSLLSGLWAEIGLSFDPGGQPASIGFVVDPNGRSQPGSLFGEIGLSADPSGLTAPVPPPTGDIGLSFDPDG